MAGKKGRSGRKKKHVEGKHAEQSRCSVCGETKPYKDPITHKPNFYLNAGRRSGLSAECIACNSIARLEASYRREIREKGRDAFQQRILDLEDRVTLMRRILHKYSPQPSSTL